MDADNKAAAPRVWQCAAAGGIAGVAPVLFMMAAHWLAPSSDMPVWLAFAPGVAAYLCGWGVAGACSAVSVALQWPDCKAWPLPVWMIRITQWLLIPAWAACLGQMPALSFGLLFLLAVTAAVTVRVSLRGKLKDARAMASALLACPLLLWVLYLTAALYLSLMAMP